MRKRLRRLLLTAASLTVAVAASACGPDDERGASGTPTSAGAEPVAGTPTAGTPTAAKPSASSSTTASQNPTPARTLPLKKIPN
ncbi:hypothetical protein P1P75_41415, partial [Streptomyces sp. ID05-39B]|nr:hypothetical protein [Streptomyces sp. ID05-39B]